MQVDRSNFEAVLPSILTHIQLADFVSFDCQFTGLVTNLDPIEGMFSNHIQFYERIKETAYNFGIIQLGLAAFIYNQGKYVPHVYNIYVSPTTFAPGFNNVVVCEVESMEFLARNHLDFGRVFSHGIKSRRILAEDQTQKHRYNQTPPSSWGNIFLSPQQQQIITQIQEQLLPTLANPKLERIVNFTNKTLFNYIRLKYPGLTFDKGKKNLKLFEYIIKFRPSVHAEEQLQKGLTLEKNQKIQESEGQKGEMKEILIQQTKEQVEKQEIVMVAESMCLSKVFSALISAKKPIVDIGLIYQTFIADLPETYDSFCQALTKLFPWLLDTKIISRRIQSKLKGLKVDLPSLFKACSNPKLLKPYANLDISHLADYASKQHEAGYDAFITGCSFVGMANFMRGETGRINFNLLKPENYLFYSRSSGQVSLNGNGFCSNAIHYDQLIVVLPSPKHPQWRDLAQLLSKFGSLSAYEEHEEMYFVYEEPKDIAEILSMVQGWNLRKYADRRILKARNMFRGIQYDV